LQNWLCGINAAAVLQRLIKFAKEKTMEADSIKAESAGAFKRQEDHFNQWVRRDGSTQHPAAPGRYHLYISLACPWAHRTLIVRHLKKLEGSVSMSAVDPIRSEDSGWAFRPGPGHGPDLINGFSYLSEAYRASDPAYSGRVTVPVLWDKEKRCIVSNNDDHILRMFNSEFDAYSDNSLDLYPEALREEIDALNEWIYPDVNNGVYRTGFATTQGAYEDAATQLFAALDRLDERLARQPYLTGDRLTEADWKLFPTLVRFDAVYYVHFKCNIRRIADYPHLSGYLRQLYQQPGIADTVNFDHIKRHYYYTHDDINPFRIVPLGPDQNLGAPHGREGIRKSV
jgi:glutathionyl-hydroquinone reductase